MLIMTVNSLMFQWGDMLKNVEGVNQQKSDGRIRIAVHSVQPVVSAGKNKDIE